MDHLEPMAVVYAGYELLEEPPRLWLRHPPICDDVVEQLATSIFQYNDDVRRRRDYFIANPMDGGSRHAQTEL